MTDNEMVSYAHESDPKGQRFCQYKKDKLPPWAVDVQPYIEMTDIVERLRTRTNGINPSLDIMRDEAADEIEYLRQQLAECQAREKVLREVLKLSWSEEYVNGIETGKKAEEAIAMPFDSTALDEAIKQAKREALLEAAERFGKDQPEYSASKWAYRALREMAEGLKCDT